MDEFDASDIRPGLRSVLIIGQEGSGKTAFLGTMPRPLYLFSFDGGYRTLAGEPGITIATCMEEDRKHPKAYRDFRPVFDDLVKGVRQYRRPDGTKEPYRSIALDPFTFLSRALFNHFQYINSNIDKPGGYTIYGMVKSYSQEILDAAARAVPYVGVTALVESYKDEATGELFFGPMAEGSIREEMGAWFDAVFYLSVDKVSDGAGVVVKRRLTLVGSRREKAKIRVPVRLASVFASTEVPDFGLLEAKMKEASDRDAALRLAAAAPALQAQGEGAQGAQGAQVTVASTQVQPAAPAPARVNPAPVRSA